MNTSSTYNVVIFLNSTFYTNSLDQIIEPLISNQSAIVYLFNIHNQEKLDLTHWEKKNNNIKVEEITSQFVPPTLTEETLVIDALFGFELQHPLSGGFAAVARLINSSKSTVVSIGAPSGLFPEDNTTNNLNHIIKANYTILTEEPPLACYFDENQPFLGQWNILPINPKKEEDLVPFTSEEEVIDIIKPRRRFSHKGTYGHGLLVAGSLGMAGACSMAASASLKSGIGLLTIHTPLCNRAIHQVSTPEAMVDCDTNEICFSQLLDTTGYKAVAVGPGLGLAEESATALQHLILQCDELGTPLIIDADGLNILANYPHLYRNIKGAILTPHPVEIERLIGKCNNSYIRLNRAIEFAKKFEVFIILKDAYSFVICPDGSYQLNPTGNEGMATGGSGDVLTGILLALRAQGYSQEECIKLGTYIHGKAGDLAALEVGKIGMTAQDIIKYLPKAWKELSETALKYNGFNLFSNSTN
ncbi:YjeF-related protein [Bacteroides coprosuis DSM 18011]|uniref:ADP-dependent (S)-NAD(P)H-hydrate dehydratase n=1 Tax=Bacteroides coprosuis DSM 18011 TaxID=679937 RepID=F3ZSR3_9BACE|nr:YjeF-related protein [Bacteroides coprosuis DSM 18011]